MRQSHSWYGLLRTVDVTPIRSVDTPYVNVSPVGVTRSTTIEMALLCVTGFVEK
jgi:hypothetical protein